MTMMQNHTVCDRWPGRPQGLHREGFSQVEGQGEDFGEDKHKAQYISRKLFKHNHCSSFLRSNRPLPETIMMSVSG